MIRWLNNLMLEWFNDKRCESASDEVRWAEREFFIVCQISYNDIMLYHVMLYHIVSYYIISYYIISNHIILYYNIPYHVISYHIMSHHIILYHIISRFATKYWTMYYNLINNVTQYVIGKFTFSNHNII